MEHFIRIYDDVLSADFCADVILRFDTDPHRFDGTFIGADNRPKVNPAGQLRVIAEVTEPKTIARILEHACPRRG
jgi:hypothetical protein